MNQETIDFIRLHAQDDVQKLALAGNRFPLVDMPYALQQIAGRQAACNKLPAWAAIDDLIYPPHLSMEQCSSQPTARYKALLIQRLLEQTSKGSVQNPAKNEDFIGLSAPSIVDLTGGLGVDISFMAQQVPYATYVERQEMLCDIARHNFPLIQVGHVKVICGDGEAYLHRLDFSTFIFLDPARRDLHGGKTVAIADCTPNVLTLKEELTSKSLYTLVKLSPMLDWHQAVIDLNESCDIVREIHLVSVKNECKELLFVLSSKWQDPLKIYCVNDDSAFSCAFSSASDGQSHIFQDTISPGDYLYEPNASLMKAGCFEQLAVSFGVKAIAINSHLFLSKTLINDFPGRKFKIVKCSSFNKKELKESLTGIRQANIAIRNFPMTVAELRKKLKLKDGGASYLFATTDSSGNRWLLITHRVE